MNILITGVHGFVGTNLSHAIGSGNTIYGLDIIEKENPFVQKTFTWQDLEAGVIPPVDAIIHLAGKAHDTKNQSKADIYFQINTELTKKIFDYFLASDARKFIFFSSVKAAADTVQGDYIDENVVPKPVGPYGESKIKAEEYIQNKFSPQPNGEKQVYILRPCMIHGPGNKGNLNLLYKVIEKGVPYPLGKFNNLRTFTSIDNLCFIVNGILTKDIDSGIFHIADDEPLSTTQLVEIISDTLGKKAHIWNTPKWMINAIARCGDFLPIPLNSDRLKKLTENYIARNDKVKAALGITRLPVKAQDGLRKTIESFNK